VVQDYSKNMLAIETGFNELRTTLFYQVMFNPTLFDTRLSRLENQLRSLTPSRPRCIRGSPSTT